MTMPYHIVKERRTPVMAKARVSTYIWQESFERLKAISDRTKKPMTELLDEAIELLAQRYDLPPEPSETIQ
jgi:hypothetical protein